MYTEPEQNPPTIDPKALETAADIQVFNSRGGEVLSRKRLWYLSVRMVRPRLIGHARIHNVHLRIAAICCPARYRPRGCPKRSLYRDGSGRMRRLEAN